MALDQASLNDFWARCASFDNSTPPSLSPRSGNEIYGGLCAETPAVSKSQVDFEKSTSSSSFLGLSETKPKSSNEESRAQPILNFLCTKNKTVQSNFKNSPLFKDNSHSSKNSDNTKSSYHGDRMMDSPITNFFTKIVMKRVNLSNISPARSDTSDTSVSSNDIMTIDNSPINHYLDFSENKSSSEFCSSPLSSKSTATSRRITEAPITSFLRRIPLEDRSSSLLTSPSAVSDFIFTDDEDTVNTTSKSIISLPTRSKATTNLTKKKVSIKKSASKSKLKNRTNSLRSYLTKDVASSRVNGIPSLKNVTPPTKRLSFFSKQTKFVVKKSTTIVTSHNKNEISPGAMKILTATETFGYNGITMLKESGILENPFI
ncbi:hypothetical protein G9A89_007946 [Geosiphon pyriformis]|nr:hypothetical protein G9A89_007946 [Geosiphon pyriformis]